MLERLELVRRVHAGANYVFGKADLVSVVISIENAADRLGLLDLLALNPQHVSEAAASPIVTR